jgi:hypothetical protein
MPARQNPAGAFCCTPVSLGWVIVVFTFVTRTHLLVLYCEPRPVSHVRLAVGLII